MILYCVPIKLIKTSQLQSYLYILKLVSELFNIKIYGKI